MNTTAMAARTIKIMTQAETPLGLGVGFCCLAISGGWVLGGFGGSRDGVVVGDAVVVCIPYKTNKTL